MVNLKIIFLFSIDNLLNGYYIVEFNIMFNYFLKYTNSINLTSVKKKLLTIFIIISCIQMLIKYSYKQI